VGSTPGVLDYRFFISDTRWREWMKKCRESFWSFREIESEYIVCDRPTVSSSPIKMFPLKCLCPSCYSADRQLHWLNSPRLALPGCVWKKASASFLNLSTDANDYYEERLALRGGFSKQLRHFCMWDFSVKPCTLFTLILVWQCAKCEY